MSQDVTVRGVVVSRRLRGEGSLRVALYTDSLGLVEAVANSAREERSKLRAHLQEGTMGTFTLVKGSNWRLTGAVETKNIYFALEENANAKEAVARVITTVRQFVRGEGSDPYLFSVLWYFLSEAGLFEDKMREAECLAVLRILSCLGYVSERGVVEGFLSPHYDRETLHLAHTNRAGLVKVINEGISASQL